MTMIRAITASRRLASHCRPRPVSTAERLIERIRSSVIGDDAVLDGPFGPRRMVYADATASGRSLAFVEDFVRDQVLPMYANTHTEASATGRRTTAMREEARGIIHRAVNGGDDDVGWAPAPLHRCARQSCFSPALGLSLSHHRRDNAGDPARAEAALRDAERVAGEIGDRWFLSTILVDRAHVLLAQDSLARAAAAVARIEEVPAPNDLEWRIKRLAARGRLAAREGHAEQALAEARAAVALAEPTELFLFRADAWRDLAEVADRVGETEEAAAARAAALRFYRAEGNVAAAGQLSAPARAVVRPSR